MTIFLVGSLLSQYVIEISMRDNQMEFEYFRKYPGNTNLRITSKQRLLDEAVARQQRLEDEGANVGAAGNPYNIRQKFILPANFERSPRYYIQRYIDAITLLQEFGTPDFLLTMTTNLKWPKII